VAAHLSTRVTDRRYADELGKSGGVNLTTRPQLHMAPALARSLQQASRVPQQRTEEEADVDVIFERVDVAKRRVVDAGGRTSVVHQLAHIAAALPHAREPRFHEGTQVIALRTQPAIDRRIVFYRRWEAQDVIHEGSAGSRPSIPLRAGARARELEHQVGGERDSRRG
jgi:hypothetical protein